MLCEVTAKPRNRLPFKPATDTVEPGTGVHVTPSIDVDALKVVPLRLTSRYVGADPIAATCAVLAPWAPRHCTTMPLLGVTNSA